ncbi:MAG: GumC family protein [Bacillota bacterium]
MEENKSLPYNEEMEIDLKELIMLIWRRKMILIGLVIVAMLVTYASASMISPEYQSSTKVLISEEEEQLREFIAQGRTVFSSQNTEIYKETIMSRSFLEKVSEKVGKINSKNDYLPASELADIINIRTGSVDNLLILQVTYTNPRLAKKIADETANTLLKVHKQRQVSDLDRALEFISSQLDSVQESLFVLEQEINKASTNSEERDEAEELDLSSLTSLNSEINLEDMANIESNFNIRFLEIEKNIAENTYNMLREQQEELRLQRNIQPTEIEIIEAAALPTSPVSPRINLMVVISAVLAAMFGVGIIFVLEFFDTRIKSKKQLEDVSGKPVLGVIPEIIEKEKKFKAKGGDKDEE